MSNKPDKEAILKYHYGVIADEGDKRAIFAAMEFFSASQNSELKRENELLEDRDILWQNKHELLKEEIEKLQSTIEEKDDRINDLEILLDAARTACDLNRIDYDNILEEKDMEIKKLINLIWKSFHLSVCDLPVEEMTEYWNKFKTENNL